MSRVEGLNWSLVPLILPKLINFGQKYSLNLSQKCRSSVSLSIEVSRASLKCSGNGLSRTCQIPDQDPEVERVHLLIHEGPISKIFFFGDHQGRYLNNFACKLFFITLHIISVGGDMWRFFPKLHLFCVMGDPRPIAH